MKVSFIATVLNEEKNIELLLNSILKQTRRPDEVVIVDGGSKDKTIDVIKNWIEKIRSEDFKKKIKLISKKGNRSIGRNEAIEVSKSDIIVCSDSGCILDKNWIKIITFPFKDPNIDVVSGFYKGLFNSIFEKALIPYVLVMPDRANPTTFLPSSRSMAFRKEIWRGVGGFPSRFSRNEDFIFARKLKRLGSGMVFKKRAIVYFFPRKNLIEAFLMFFNFGFGDAEAGILRPKVTLILIRYTILIWLLIYAYFFKLFFIVETVFYILILYILWSIFKNYKYVKDREAFIFLPVIQFTSDVAIISGTVLGFFKGIWDTQKR